jgi:hypothetical protein
VGRLRSDRTTIASQLLIFTKPIVAIVAIVVITPYKVPY